MNFDDVFLGVEPISFDQRIEFGQQRPTILFIYRTAVVADGQKRKFRQNPQNSGDFIREGLWAKSRHPNYFGEITLWIGVAVTALPMLNGWQHVVLISPVFVFLLLSKIKSSFLSANLILAFKTPLPEVKV